MNNDELKKKITDIVIEAIWKDAEADYDSTDETEARSIADALIAVGIRDVKEAKHRAEVAEMALKIVCRMQENLNILVDGKPWTKEEIYNLYIEQAEKELAEEGER